MLAMSAMTSAKLIGGLIIAGLASTAFGQGAVFRCIDDNGRPQYTNVKTDTDGKKCTVVTREVSVVPNVGAAPTPTPAPAAGTRPSPTAAANPSAGASPGGFPRVDPQTQRSRDDGRRRILEDELSQERRSLDKAKSDLAQQENTREGGEKNYQRVLDRMKPYQDAVERHQRNVGALEKELGAR
jgi:hypothetical protein